MWRCRDDFQAISGSRALAIPKPNTGSSSSTHQIPASGKTLPKHGKYYRKENIGCHHKSGDDGSLIKWRHSCAVEAQLLRETLINSGEMQNEGEVIMSAGISVYEKHTTCMMGITLK